MKKLLAFAFVFIILGFAACSQKDVVYDNVSVGVVQSVSVPGGTYAPVDNAITPSSKLQKGVFNLRYDFTINAPKDNNRALIAMNINFPDEISVNKLTYTGIYQESQVNHEYYISQHKGGTGGIEFEVKIPERLYDKKFPIDITFRYYEMENLYWRYTKRGAIIGGVVGLVFGEGVGAIPGAILGAPIGLGIAYYKDEFKSGGPSLNDMLRVTPRDMNESRKRFMVSVIR